MDPEEIKIVLPRRISSELLPVAEVQRLLGLSPSQLSSLLHARDKEGLPLLQPQSFHNAKGTSVSLFSRHDVMDFIDRYVTLKEHADGLRRPFKHVKVELDARGVEPVSPKPIMGRLLYRRLDLQP